MVTSHRWVWASGRFRWSCLVLTMLGALAGLWLLRGVEDRRQPSRRPKAAANSRLLSIIPLPETGGEMCQWMPASAAGSLRAARWQERRTSGETGSSPDAARRAEAAKRKPIRMIRDQYSTFSSVAVDPLRNEVVLTDENLFNLLVYDRLTNTPPAAAMSEPKRVIGGVNTKVEFQCGLYIDPKSGDIYAVNNDSVNTLVVFSRQAKGNVPPNRELETPHGTFGIAVDEGREELFLTVQHDNAVVVYHKMAKNQDSPVRLLQGNRTQMADPHGIALDLKNKRMFVANYGAHHRHDDAPVLERDSGDVAGKANWPRSRANMIPGSGRHLPPSITVYPLDAGGDIAPIQVIQGPRTQMNWPAGLAIDEERGELFVANDMGDSVLVFSTSAQGDAAPVRVLKGPKTLIKNPTGVYFDAKNNELWVASFMNHTATVFNPAASGDTAPLRVIRSGPLDQPALGIGNPHPVAYDTKREEILVPN